MAKLKESDFYYGAILSMLLNNGICPMLIEGGDNRRVYEFTTNKKNFRLFLKYRSSPLNTKKEDYWSWQFIFSDGDMDYIRECLNSENLFVIGLVCGVEGLNNSEYAALQREHIEEIIKQGKTSVTLSRRKGEHDFRLSTGGGRENSMRIKASKIY